MKLLGLIGCEESQEVTKAFRALGHEFYSCDLISCSGGYPEWHLQMDVLEAIEMKKWDFIGLHPDCTKMTLSGNKHYGKGKPRHHERIAAVEWTIGLWEKAVKQAPSVYLENPMGAMNGDQRLPVPQIVQPFHFGDAAQKTTCLWLYGLKKLVATSFDAPLFGESVDKGSFDITKGGNKLPSWYNLPPSEDRKKIRSKTFTGMAMANQWATPSTPQPLHSPSEL